MDNPCHTNQFNNSNHLNFLHMRGSNTPWMNPRQSDNLHHRNTTQPYPSAMESSQMDSNLTNLSIPCLSRGAR